MRRRRITLATFAISGGLSALTGTLLAGNPGKAYRGISDGCLLPGIAALMLSGTSILGGRGSCLCTTAGVILIKLLQSILPVVQMPRY